MEEQEMESAAGEEAAEAGELGESGKALPEEPSEDNVRGEPLTPDSSGGAVPKKLPKEALEGLARRLAVEHTARTVSQNRKKLDAGEQRRELQDCIQGQLREISGMDPEVRTLRDLREKPGYERVCQMVEKGYGLADAYRLVNFEKLSQKAALSARQSALNSLAGRSHLNRTSSLGTGSAPVPAELAEEYRRMVPGATDLEIQTHYNRYLRSHNEF